MDIDQFLDVDFTKDPKYVFGDLGCPLFGECGPFYEDAIPVLSDAEIDEAIDRLDADGGGLDTLVTRIYDQGREGSCVANATCQAHEVLQAIQYGKDKVIPLAAMWLYQSIGSGPNSGAMISDGWESAKKKGLLPLDTPENRARFGNHVMANTGWRSKRPDGADATAVKLRFDEGHFVRSVNGIFSALARQKPVVVGREGHSICYVRPMRKNGSRIVKYANSWGAWGDNGFGYDSANQVRKSASWAFVPRSAVILI